MNQFKTTVSITRGELCDIILALCLVWQSADDGGRKWEALHGKLQTQLEELDQQLYQIEKIGADLYR